MKLLVLSCGLSAKSRSTRRAEELVNRWPGRSADAVALAVPIYNYDVGGAARNLLAMTGRIWQEKVVGLLAAAGGERSAMSLMPVANSLMLDFRCVIVPRMVYASPATFDGAGPIDGELEQRIEGLARDLLRFSKALALNP